MTEDDDSTRIDRRKFLKKVGVRVGVGVATVGGMGAIAYGTKKLLDNTLLDPNYKFPYSGDESRPMGLADVEAEYARVYDQLAEAKSKAEAENKQLRVVMGELHDLPRSFIHSLIVSDVAVRLGIADCVVEQPKESFQSLSENCKSIRNSRYSIFDSHSFTNLELRPHAERFKKIKASPHKDLLPYMHSVLNLGMEAEARLAREPNNDDYAPSQACTFSLTGGRVHCGDPERVGPNGEKRARHDPIV